MNIFSPPLEFLKSCLNGIADFLEDNGCKMINRNIDGYALIFILPPCDNWWYIFSSGHIFHNHPDFSEVIIDIIYNGTCQEWNEIPETNKRIINLTDPNSLEQIWQFITEMHNGNA